MSHAFVLLKQLTTITDFSLYKAFQQQNSVTLGLDVEDNKIYIDIANNSIINIDHLIEQSVIEIKSSILLTSPCYNMNQIGPVIRILNKQHQAYLAQIRQETKKQSILTYVKHNMEKCKTIDVNKIVSIDFEMYEHNQNTLLEVGIARFIDGVIDTQHFIFKENRHHTNGQFVPDNSTKFLFGTTQVLPRNQIIKTLDDILSTCDICIAHGVVTEKKILKKDLGLILDHVLFVDTSQLYQFKHNVAQETGLSRCCEHYNIDTKYHHNGGNDAHRTMLVLLELIK